MGRADPAAHCGTARLAAAQGGTSRPFLQCISQFDHDFVYHGEDVYSIAKASG
jgi:hypothetical protein